MILNYFLILASGVFLKSFNGHTNAVWGIKLIDNTLVSISADSTIRLWNLFGADESEESESKSVKCLNESKSIH